MGSEAWHTNVALTVVKKLVGGLVYAGVLSYFWERTKTAVTLLRSWRSWLWWSSSFLP